MAKKEAFLQFLKAARSLQDRGLSKEAIVQFAKNEFGELSELFKKQIDSLFKPKKGIENIKIKDPDFDDTIVKMQFDDAGVPFNPKDPLKTKTLSYEEAIAREKARADADEDYIMKIFDPEDFAQGGRAGYGLGSLVKNIATSNPQILTPVQNYAMSDNSILGPAAKSAASNIMEGQAKNQAALNIFNQSTPKVDARMNLDYDTLINQNEAQRNLQAQQRNPGIMRPTIADVAGPTATQDSNSVPVGTRIISDGRNRYAVRPNGSLSFINTVTPNEKDYINNFNKGPIEGYKFIGNQKYNDPSVGLNLSGDFLEFTGYGDERKGDGNFKYLQDIDQTDMPRAITQDDIDTFNFNMSDPMMTGFDYSKENNWSPGQPAPDGYRVVDMMGDQFLERMYPSKEEVARLPGMIGPMGPMPLGLMMPPSGDYRDLYREDPDAGLSGQEIAEKYGLEYAKGGRAGHYTGGMVDVEPNLSDIGHGSDALMARTRLVSPDGQATTSTGLNYLLAEDNDNIRVPFSKGKIAKEVLDKGRRGFMKAAGAAGAGIAALKTGLLGFGKEAAPVVEKAAETVSNTMGEAPAYFLNLVQKIKNLGSEYSPKYSGGREKITNYKDYTLTENLTTGETTIQRFKQSDVDYYDEMLMEENYMNYKPGMADETTKGKTPPGEYTEDTGYLRTSGPQKGDLVIEGEPIPKDIIEEGTIFEDNMTEFGKTKKADGGRIGFESGKIVLGKNIYNLLKNNKKIKKAIDNIFGTGDYKLDADMAAESLVELNPKEFNNMLYEDLPDNVRSEIYGAVIGPIQNNALIASRAKKTANTIDISDPKVAEDFTNFMKNHGDPAAQKAIKELEETLLLSNAKRTKGRKDNSSGGIQTMLGE